jgi:hypothetical protein
MHHNINQNQHHIASSYDTPFSIQFFNIKMKIAITTFFALVTGFGSAQDEQSSQLLRGGLVSSASFRHNTFYGCVTIASSHTSYFLSAMPPIADKKI